MFRLNIIRGDSSYEGETEWKVVATHISDDNDLAGVLAVQMVRISCFFVCFKIEPMGFADGLLMDEGNREDNDDS